MADKEKREPATAAELRRRAEELLREKSPELHPHRTADETQRLVHELEVHQIELEIQNAELLRARDEAEEALTKYIDLYDFAPISYFTLDSKGVILDTNFSGASLLGIERSRLIGMRFDLYVATEDRPFFSDFLGKVFANRGKEVCKIVLVKTGKTPLNVRMQALAAPSGEECRVAAVNISELMRVQDELAAKNVQLETALAKIRQLEGIIPICSYCKKIKDEKGNWFHFETYITDHSEALFSHGFCPECYERQMSALKKREPH